VRGRSAASPLVAIATAIILMVATGVAQAASPGPRLWVRLYDGPLHGQDGVAAIAVSPDSGTVFVTGNSQGALTDQDAVTIAYASDGSRLWARRYDGPAHAGDGGVDIGVSPDGATVYMTGLAGGPSSSQILVIAYDATNGARVWGTRVGSQLLFDEVAALAVSPDGSTLFVTGVRRYFDDSDIRTIALDASSGSVLWTRRFEGSSQQPSSPTDVRVSPDGSLVVVTGWFQAAGTDLTSTKGVTLAYDVATGTRRWVQRFDGAVTHGEDRAVGVEIAPDSSAVYVAMTSESAAHGLDILALGYDVSTGSELWRHRYDGPDGLGDEAAAIGLTPDGASAFVTGRSITAIVGSVEVTDYATIAVDTGTGHRKWVRRYDEGIGGHDDPIDLGVAPDGSRVYVTGTSEGLVNGVSSATDFATLAYDASTGTRLGLQRYDGPCGFVDTAVGLAIAPNGSNVYVTGGTGCFDPNTSGDIATIAYPA
jgi:WD40 repeat protein